MATPVWLAIARWAKQVTTNSRTRAEPERSGAVAVDPRTQDHAHGEAADHADADDPAEMEFGSAQQGDEIGIAEEQRHGRRRSARLDIYASQNGRS